MNERDEGAAAVEYPVELAQLDTAANEVNEGPFGTNVSDGTGHEGNYSIQPRVVRIGDARTAKSRAVMFIKFGWLACRPARSWSKVRGRREGRGEGGVSQHRIIGWEVHGD